MPGSLSPAARARRKAVLASLDRRMAKALRLWMRYRTTSREYMELAKEMNITPVDLNVRCSEIYGSRIVLGRDE